jgi:D-beta-D-heptose 7-phosphate kinase/D-beta-D-heptose 1-phosphate adenosyltransferase
MNPLVVIGDTLLDVDLDGSSERLCPDAPVPVLDVQHRRLRPGGAGLAAMLAARSGVDVQLITCVGQDEPAQTLLALLGDHLEVLAQPLQGTTATKTRLRLGRTPILRVDSGTGIAGTAPLTAAARTALQQAGAVLVSDYGHGMARHLEFRDLLADRSRGVPLIWDPHPRGACPVPGATLVTPNRTEAERVVHGAADDRARGTELCRLWQADAVAITVGHRGAILTDADRDFTERIPVPRRLRSDNDSGSDTCGAGDRFSTAAADALRRGRSVREAVTDAVEQAAAFVAAGGASGHSVSGDTCGPLTPVVAHQQDLDRLLVRTRRAGGRVVATGGCFDLLHRGHVTLLQQARALGDLLVVCLNSDASVRRAKGPSRPVVAEEDRARVLSALAAVDAVVLFDEETPTAVLDRIRPDIWVKGDDYADRHLPEAEVVTRHGGRIEFLPLLPGYSTTRLVEAGRRPPGPSRVP